MPTISASNFLRKKKKSVSNPDCPVCVPTPAAPAFQCFEGHLICEGCLETQEKCPTCEEHYPERRIRARRLSTDLCSCCHKQFDHVLIIDQENLRRESLIESRQIAIQNEKPLGFHRIHGSLVKVFNDNLRLMATGSDLSLGVLAFAFFGRPIKTSEKISIRVSMASQRSLFLLAGFSNEDPSTIKNLPNFFTSSCYFKIRDSRANEAVVNFDVNGNGRMEVEVDGKMLYKEQTFHYSKNLQTSQPMWAYVRIFHKNDQIEILNQ